MLADGHGRALVTRITPGQAADTKELVPLLDAVAVPRPGGQGRHRKRLDHLTADKAYGSKANRRSLRAREIPHTIPERDDVRASRARKGSRGGRPPNFNPDRYKTRNQVERGFGRLKNFRAVATRYDKLKHRYAAAAAPPRLIGRDQIVAALRTWPPPHPELPHTVVTIADVVLVGYLAVQAACADAGLPLPAIGELDAQRCERELGHWRLDLSRPNATDYLHHRRPGTTELALAATARVTEHATVSVVVVSQRNVADADVADLGRAVAAAKQLP